MLTIKYVSTVQYLLICFLYTGAQWLSGRVFDSRPKGRGFEPHGRHCVVSLSKNINPSLVLVQPRKTPPYITERLLMGRKESNQTKTKLPIHTYSKVVTLLSIKRLQSSYPVMRQILFAKQPNFTID